MSFTTVPTKVSGDVFTAAMWTTYVQGNLNTGVLRALGDSILGSDQASVTFSSIDQNFAHLLLAVYGRSDRAAVTDSIAVRFNADSGANYYEEFETIAGTTATPNESLGSSRLEVGTCPANTAAANLFASALGFIGHYAQAINKKSLVAMTGLGWGTTTGMAGLSLFGGYWNNTAALTTVAVIPSSGTNIKTGSRATLYGMPF